MSRDSCHVKFVSRDIVCHVMLCLGDRSGLWEVSFVTDGVMSGDLWESEK